MRILMAISQFQRGCGGAEASAHRLARRLIERGHNIEIITGRPGGTPCRETVDGVPLRRLFTFGAQRGGWRLAPYSYMPLLAEQLIRRRGEHDIVHVHQAFHPAFAATVVRRRARGRPVVVKVATSGEFGDLHQMRTGTPTLPRGSSRMLETILRSADAFVAVSSAVADELAAAGVPSRRIARIPNGLPLPEPPSRSARAEARRSLGIADGEPLVLYVGRSGRQKGSDLLVAAWRELEGETAAAPSARLCLLGDGFLGDRAFMNEVAAMPGVMVPGKVHDVDRYLRAADLFVLPSRGEGLSNALLEAMAHGVPSLVSDLAANRDLVIEGQTGFTVPAGDQAALAAALRRCLADLAALRPLAQAARARVASGFGIDGVCAAYEKLYDDLRAS
jgi:glycosyltransferase involved in cell wall biosynthesis